MRTAHGSIPNVRSANAARGRGSRTGCQCLDGKNSIAADTMKEVIGRIRSKAPQIRIIGATVTTALGSSSAAHGFPEQDQKRRALNDYIRTSGLFDGVICIEDMTMFANGSGSGVTPGGAGGSRAWRCGPWATTGPSRCS